MSAGSGEREARSLLAGLLLWSWTLCACAQERPPEQTWSALLVTFDTTRADALGSYGGRAEITPHLDAFAQQGVAFERAYTVTPLTLPAHASMLTGLIPPRHGLRVNGTSRLADEATTLAEAARAEGITTAAFVSAAVLDPAFGLAQGFDLYDAPKHSLVQETSHYSDRPAREVVADASRWLRARRPDERFLLWVHLWDPHGPWDPPPELRALAPDDATGYLGDVASADRAFGALMRTLEELGRSDTTLVAVVADHGEAFWEHGEYSHGALLHEPTMRVPFLLRFPDGRRAGERSDEIVSVVDVHPTLAEALGISVCEEHDGHSRIAPAGAEQREHEQAYLETYYGYFAYGWAPLVGLVDSKGKYLFGGTPRLFDPRADPGEEQDLAPQRPAELERYRAAVLAFAARPSLQAGAAATDAALGQELSDLGYATGPAERAELPAPHAAVAAPDPATRIGEHSAMLDALGAFNAGDYERAEERYGAVLAQNPRNVEALERLGITLIRQRRFREALVPLEAASASGKESAAGAVNLGTCYRKLEVLDRARAAFERALALDGSQVRAVRHLVDLCLLAGDRERASAYAARYAELTGETLSAR